VRTALRNLSDESGPEPGQSSARSVRMSGVRRYPRLFLHVSRFLGDYFLVHIQIEKD